MSARFLLTIFDSVYLLALAAWLGSILFLSFAVIPVIFLSLDGKSAGQFVRALFPRYYAWGATSGAVALAAYVAGVLCFPEFRGPRVGIQAMLILGSTLVMLYSGNSLTPAINAAQDQGPSQKALFRRLHSRSVYLNIVVMLVAVGLIILHASRPAPRTFGIIEPEPADAARHEYGVGLKLEQPAAADVLDKVENKD